MGANMPDAGVLATILLIVGLFLLALELMIPSFGMIGILSAITLLVSAWCAWQAWWSTSPGFFWTYAAFWVLGIPAVLGGTLFVLQHTSFGNHIVLRGPEPADPVNDHGGLSPLIGQIGEAASLMCPGGMVTVNQQRFHAESRGMMIEAGTLITVTGVRGTRLLVQIHEPSSDDRSPPPAEDHIADTIVATDAGPSAGGRTPDSTGILDFDIPEG